MEAFPRGRFRNGYQCHAYGVIQKDGNEVRVGSMDGEAEDDTLSAAWMASSIYREFFKLRLRVHIVAIVDAAGNPVVEYECDTWGLFASGAVVAAPGIPV